MCGWMDSSLPPPTSAPYYTWLKAKQCDIQCIRTPYGRPSINQSINQSNECIVRARDVHPPRKLHAPSGHQEPLLHAPEPVPDLQDRPPVEKQAAAVPTKAWRTTTIRENFCPRRSIQHQSINQSINQSPITNQQSTTYRSTTETSFQMSVRPRSTTPRNSRRISSQ